MCGLGYGVWVKYFKEHMKQGRGCTLASTYSEKVLSDLLLAAFWQPFATLYTTVTVVRQDQVGLSSGLNVWMRFFKEHMIQGTSRTLAA